jgi:hypothetical protein
VDQTDASLDSVFSAVRGLLIAFGGILSANGYGDSGLYKWVEIGAGSVLVVGPLVWGVIDKIQKFRQKKAAVTAGVNAGMALAASGQMLVHANGSPVTASDETAKEIVQTFAPEAKAA